jgi:hypothetical protein
VELLYCADLDEAPSHIEQVFSAVLGDTYHGMDRSKVPVRHEYKKPYKVALSRAWLQWNKSKLDEVSGVLKENGWTDEDINNKMYFKHSFFAERVERVQLPPCQLYWRVRAVFVKFGNKIDSKTGLPLFNKAAWGKAKSLLKEILLGYYSDPPGASFYRYQLSVDGMPKVDRHGINLIHCCRGTNDVENIHKHYHTIFRYTAGIELGDCLLAERRHRHNNRMAVLRIPDYPKLGHYNTWQIDKLQILVEKNHGILLFPSWINASDYCDSAESFVTVAMHSEELDTALKEHCTRISDAVKSSYKGDLLFLCRQSGTPIPFLPVHGPDEYKLFTCFLLHALESFDENKMALLWIEKVDGVKVFPKHPHQLRSYHKKWERNRRVQNAFQKMKSDFTMLETLNEEQIPAEMDAGDEVMDTGNEAMDWESNGEVGISDCMVPECGLLQYPQASLLPTLLPTLQGIRPNLRGIQVCVGLERIGGHYIPGELPPLKRYQGNRGQDKKKRRGRRCKLCIERGRHEAAATCKGRAGQEKCEHEHR